MSADIQSPYTFGVRCFNEKIRFSLTSSVQEIWALENRVKIGPDTLKARNFSKNRLFWGHLRPELFSGPILSNRLYSSLQIIYLG